MKRFDPLRPECPNCYPDQPFCPDCGAKKFRPEDHAIKHFLKELISEVTDMDSKLLRTLYLLTFRPGYLTEANSKGIQAPYIRPFRLLISIAIVHFLAFGLSGSADIYQLHGPVSTLVQVEHLYQVSFLKEHLRNNYDVDVVNQSIKNVLSGLEYVIIFILAWFYYVLFRRKYKYYSEHLVFFVHVLAAGLLRNMMLLPVAVIHEGLGLALMGVLDLLYVSFAIRRFYKMSYGSAWLMIMPTLMVVIFLTMSSWTVAAIVSLWKWP